MSEVMFVVSGCIGCKKIITYNPDKVPSLRINGVREPLCIDCFNKWNMHHRLEKGLEPVNIHPLAYTPMKVDQ